jgi:hypothetical protein
MTPVLIEGGIAPILPMKLHMALRQGVRVCMPTFRRVGERGPAVALERMLHTLSPEGMAVQGGGEVVVGQVTECSTLGGPAGNGGWRFSGGGIACSRRRQGHMICHTRSSIRFPCSSQVCKVLKL